MIKFILVVFLVQNSLALDPFGALYTEIFTYHNETAFKADFAYQVVEKIYYSFRQWFFTVIFCEFTYFENRILKYTETMDDGYPVLLLNSCPTSNRTKVKPRIDKHGQTAYVISSDQLSLEVNEYIIGALIHTGVFKPRSAVIFVINVPVEVTSYFYYEMEKHFQLLWSRKITNSVLVVWSDRLKMYIYNPFLREVFDITEVQDVSRLLAHQYHNLYGHALRLSVFRKIYLTDETGPFKCESRLARTVMERLNATCRPLAPRDGSTVGDLLDNGTATGVTGDLIDGYTDLELSSRILKNSYYGYIDTTYPLTQDELCFIVKNSDRQPAFITTIKLISNNLLLLFFFNVFFFTTVALISRKVEMKIFNIHETKTSSSTVMDLIKCYIRQTLDVTFLGPVFRFVTLLIIIYSLIVDCAIDGVITSAITYPRYKPVLNSAEDLIKQSNLKFGVHNRHMKIFNNSLTDEFYKALEHRIEIFSDKKIKAVFEHRQYQYAVLLRKTDALYVTRKPANMMNGRPIYHIVKECPLPCFIVYGLQYGSPYLPILNNILHHLHQAGILQHWSEAEDYNLYKDFGKLLYTGNGKEIKALNIENLSEVFYVLMISLLLCVIVFIIEVLWHNFQHMFVV